MSSAPIGANTRSTKESLSVPLLLAGFRWKPDLGVLLDKLCAIKAGLVYSIHHDHSNPKQVILTFVEPFDAQYTRTHIAVHRFELDGAKIHAYDHPSGTPALVPAIIHRLIYSRMATRILHLHNEKPYFPAHIVMQALWHLGTKTTVPGSQSSSIVRIFQVRYPPTRAESNYYTIEFENIEATIAALECLRDCFVLKSLKWTFGKDACGSVEQIKGDMTELFMRCKGDFSRGAAIAIIGDANS